MMSLQQDQVVAPIFFKKYVDGCFKLNVGEFNNTLLLSSSQILKYNGEILSVNDIKKSHLQIMLKTDPEVIIIGTGNNQVLPPIEIINELAMVGKNADFMTSEAACKTYNLLVNENRNVSCIII